MNFHTGQKSQLLGSTEYNLFLTVITTSKDLLEKSQEILKDGHSRLLCS